MQTREQRGSNVIGSWGANEKACSCSRLAVRLSARVNYHLGTCLCFDLKNREYNPPFYFINKTIINRRLLQGIQRACSQSHACVYVFETGLSQKITSVLQIAFLLINTPISRKAELILPLPAKFHCFLQRGFPLLKPNAPLYEKEVCEEELYRMQPSFT